MKSKVKLTDAFKKEFKKLFKKYPSLVADLNDLIDKLEEEPTYGTALGNNLYKIRLSITSKGRGKSGGGRVISYVYLNANQVYLTSIYDKADHDTIDTKVLLKSLSDIFKKGSSQ